MAIPKERLVSYQEWLELDLGDETRAELIDGRVYMMSTPLRRHQGVLRNMAMQLSNFLLGKQCKVYFSPFAVRLEDDTEVQPDLVVICDPKKLTDRGCTGAPDLVVEILSPSTSHHDKHTKFMLYLRSGVPEYWIVDPEANVITAFRLNESGYTATTFSHIDTATITPLSRFEMDLAAVFAEE